MECNIFVKDIQFSLVAQYPYPPVPCPSANNNKI